MCENRINSIVDVRLEARSRGTPPGVPSDSLGEWSMSCNASRFFTFTGLIFGLVAFGTAQVHTSSPEPDGRKDYVSNCRTSYVSGTEEFYSSETLIISVDNEHVVLHHSIVDISISLSQIIGLGWKRTQKRVRERESAKSLLGFGDNEPIPQQYLAPVMLFYGPGLVVAYVPAKILENISREARFASISWQDTKAIRTVVLKLKSHKCGMLLSRLAGLTGIPLSNVTDIGLTLGRELEAARSDPTVVVLDRKVKVGRRELAPGYYQLRFLPRGSTQGEAFFITRNERNVEEVAAQAIAEYQDQAAEVRVADVTFVGSNGGVTISSIRTRSRILRLLPTAEPITH